MPGDADQELFEQDGQERDAGDEEMPISAHELLQELRRARERQRAQSPSPDPTDDEALEPLADEEALAGETPTALPTSSLPSWPTLPPRLSRSSRDVSRFPTAPLPNLGQAEDDELPPPLPPPLATRPRRPTQPFSAPPLPSRHQASGVPSASGVFPVWSSFRKRSPWLVPILFVLIFFGLVVLVNPRLALPLLFIFAAIGMLQAVVLLSVPNDAFWVVGVVAGFVLMTAVAFLAFFTPIFAAILSVLLLALGVVAIRERYYPVKDGTVAVMGLFEKYNRTLQPGFNLRVPGEKELGIVDTHQVRCKVHLPSLMLFTGERVALDVAMSYQVIPGQEYLAIRNTNNWKEPLQEQLIEVTQDVVSALSAADFSRQPGSHPMQTGAGDPQADPLDEEHEHSPLARINDLLTHAMRDQVADRGVAIHAVKVRLIDGPLVPGGMPASAKAPAPTPPGVTARPTIIMPSTGQAIEAQANTLGRSASPATRPLPSFFAGDSAAAQPSIEALPKIVFPGQALPFPPPAAPIAPPPRGGVAPVTTAAPSPPPPLSPQALAETYDAVLRRRITDIATIRRIVAQFEAVANDPVLSEQAPFDAAAGAQNLLHHLYLLERQQAAQTAEADSGDAASSSVPVLPPEQEDF